MKLTVAEIRTLCDGLANPELSVEQAKIKINKLKEGVVATEEVLRATSAGHRLNKLALHHKEPEIRELAKDLRDKWRNSLKNSPAGANRVSKSRPPSVTSKSSKALDAAAVKAARLISPDSSQVSTPTKRIALRLSTERTVDSDRVDWRVTKNSVRDGCVKLMYNGLAAFSDEPSEALLKVAIQVEAAGFEYFKSNTETGYKPKMRSLFQNLKNKTHPELPRNVFSGAITPAQFVSMSEEELKSEVLKNEEAMMQKVNIDKATAAKAPKSVAATFTCPKCDKKEVSYAQAQTRSADEPMTTFCDCQNCGYSWKFS